MKYSVKIVMLKIFFRHLKELREPVCLITTFED